MGNRPKKVKTVKVGMLIGDLARCIEVGPYDKSAIRDLARTVHWLARHLAGSTETAKGRVGHLGLGDGESEPLWGNTYSLSSSWTWRSTLSEIVESRTATDVIVYRPQVHRIPGHDYRIRIPLFREQVLTRFDQNGSWFQNFQKFWFQFSYLRSPTYRWYLSGA